MVEGSPNVAFTSNFHSYEINFATLFSAQLKLQLNYKWKQYKKIVLKTPENALYFYL